MANKNVLENLIGVNLKAGRAQDACHMALKAASYSKHYVQGIPCARVELSGAYAMLKDSMNPNEWAGHLSALTRAGKWLPTDGNFGTVVFR